MQALAVLQLTETKLVSESQRSACSSLPSAGIKGATTHSLFLHEAHPIWGVKAAIAGHSSEYL